ncbi:nucleotidyltransferase family protein [Bradyrhizobium sp. 192]|uniref:nucleotidyltransferase family protein n=1 Tax=Bradyrhizobium sp. 192 TaxID=2782660 RepID=UPI001FFFAF50|nr:nucleotidyltransferase family protein [Bradyrhizobium sp. 192]UPJ58231.1 nucleotidyltransferase family protein [Bradyrhizobium sp. 192]
MIRDAFLALALRNPVNVAITDALVQLALPDAWLVAGCLVQTAWNELTGRPIGHGIADYDVFYFDPDTSWEAEDAVIRTLHARLGHLGAKIEIRNQARVHLWYPAKHGLPYPPLTRSTDGIDRFLTQNTQFGVRRAGGDFDVYAPHGFDDVAGLIVRPNRALNFSVANYEAKAARWRALWPELTVIAADA